MRIQAVCALVVALSIFAGCSSRQEGETAKPSDSQPVMPPLLEKVDQAAYRAKWAIVIGNRDYAAVGQRVAPGGFRRERRRSGRACLRDEFGYASRGKRLGEVKLLANATKGADRVRIHGMAPREGDKPRRLHPLLLRRTRPRRLGQRSQARLPGGGRFQRERTGAKLCCSRLDKTTPRRFAVSSQGDHSRLLLFGEPVQREPARQVCKRGTAGRRR